MTKKGENEGSLLEEQAERLGEGAPAEALIGALAPFVPVLGPLAKEAVSQLRRADQRERLKEFALALASRVQSNERFIRELESSDAFRELTARTVEFVAQTPERGKREKYANLLVNGLEREEDEDRSEGLAMAAILDGLEYRAVQLLDRIMKLPFKQDHDGFRGGAVRTVRADRRHFRWPENDGKSLSRLEREGLLEVKWNPQPKDPNQFHVIVKPVGIDFYYWLVELGGTD